MYLSTLSLQLEIARNESNEDTTLLDLTTSGNHASMPDVLGSTGIGVIDLVNQDAWKTEVEANGVEFYLCGGDTAGDTLGWRLIGWRNSNGPARLAAIGTAVLSTQAVVAYPHNGQTATNRFWADTFVLTWQNWPDDHIGVTDTDGNSNSVGSIWLDAMGYRYWKIEITDADGSGTEAESVAAYWGLW